MLQPPLCPANHLQKAFPSGSGCFVFSHLVFKYLTYRDVMQSQYSDGYVHELLRNKQPVGVPTSILVNDTELT